MYDQFKGNLKNYLTVTLFYLFILQNVAKIELGREREGHLPSIPIA